jgi:formate--tetrahydrofolate ligase
VVAVNAFPEDPEDELEWVRARALDLGAAGASVSTHFQEGGKGASDLARTVIEAADGPVRYTPLYKDRDTIKDKIHAIATRMYGAGEVAYDSQAERDIERATQLGFGHLPICMAKTPLSLSHDPLLKGRPTGFTIPIKEVRILAGAGFLTAVCSGMQLMPGLPKVPAGEGISLDPETGEIRGLK